MFVVRRFEHESMSKQSIYSTSLSHVCSLTGSNTRYFRFDLLFHAFLYFIHCLLLFHYFSHLPTTITTTYYKPLFYVERLFLNVYHCHQ